MNYCVEKIPFSEADVTQTEDWFLEKSRSGWYPVKIFGHRAIFEHAEPAETRYRLDPMESRCPPDRKRQRETGQDWRFVAMFGKTAVYRAMQPQAKWLAAGSQQSADWLRCRLRQDVSGCFAVLSACFLILGCVLALELRHITMLSVIRGGSIPLFGEALLCLFFLAGWVALGIRMLRMQRHPQEQENLVGQERRFRTHKIIYRLAIILIAAGILVCGSGTVRSGGSCSVSEYSGRLPFAQLSELGTQVENDTVVNEVDRRSCVRTRHDPLAPEILTLRQMGTDGELFRVNYFHAASPWIAQKLKAELADHIRQLHHCTLKSKKFSGTDDALMGSCQSGNGKQFLLLVRGSQVELISLTGKKQLADYAELFISRLNG